MSDELFSKEQALAGLPARRARSVLFLIEVRAAHLAARTSQAMEPIPSEAAARERDLAFLQAYALSREPPLRATIYDLERYAPQWVYLVPQNPQLRAVVAHLLGDKYAFTYRATPGLRAALGLDAADVRAAYQLLYGASLDTIYRQQVNLAARLRWAWASLTGRLEALPPFWIAFAVSVPLGGTTLALPIALADVGPLPGIALLVVLGLVNILTIAALAEAVARHGAIRYGNAFFGRLVEDYLGRAGSLLLSLVLAAFSFGLLLVFYVGISGTLSDATSIPAEVWCLLVLAVGLYFLSRGSLNTTVGSMMIVGAINALLLLALSVLAATGWQRDNLLHANVPFLNGRPFDPAILALIFGVVLGTYFAHMSVGNFAPLLLRRDPSGRSMIWGHAAGIASMVLLASVWVLAVNGALAPEVLAGETSTVLLPLAARFGPAVQVLGSIFAVLSMGMGSIFFSLSLYNLVQERLPRQAETLAASPPQEAGRDAAVRGSTAPTSGTPAPGGDDRRATDKPSAAQRRRQAASRWGRFLLSASPVVLVCLIALWLSLTGGGSFAGLLGFLGVATSSLAAGIFPMLLLLAARRKGERLPGVVYRFLGHPLVVAGVYILFLASLLVHGLVIWTSPAERAGALLVALLTLGASAVMVRQGVFRPRLVVELREDSPGDGNTHGKPASDSALASYSLVAGGREAPADVRLLYPGGEVRCRTATGQAPPCSSLSQATFHWAELQVRELKVWVHRTTPGGESADLPVVVHVQCGPQAAERIERLAADGPVIVPLSGASTPLTVGLEFPAGSGSRPPDDRPRMPAP